MEVHDEQTGVVYFIEESSSYYHHEGNGLGFAFVGPAVAAAPSIWPAIASIGGAIASFFGSLFGGGGDDQETSYRPPANAGQQFVQFNDQHGNEYVAYDLSQASLAEAQRRGNRWEDIYSYYSAFTTNSTSAGASPAARRVIEDAAKKNNISIARAADWILRTAGVTRIVQSFLPGQQGAGSATPNLPPYCPGGSYHPFPIGHEHQDLCVPFPVDEANRQRQRSRSRTSQQQQQRQQPGVPPGYRINPQTGQFEPDPEWQADGSGPGGDKFPWWILLLIAGGLIVGRELGSSDEPRRRSKRQ